MNPVVAKLIGMEDLRVVYWKDQRNSVLGNNVRRRQPSYSIG